MTESEFQRLADETLLRIEEAIDEGGADLDYENTGGVLTLRFDNGSQVIINRQTPARQIWVAAKNGGHHFSYDAGRRQWIRQDGRELLDALGEIAQAQAGVSLFNA